MAFYQVETLQIRISMLDYQCSIDIMNQSQFRCEVLAYFVLFVDYHPPFIAQLINHDVRFGDRLNAPAH